MRNAYVNVLSHLTPQKNLASTLKLIWVSLGSLYTQRTIYKTLNGIWTFPPEHLLPWNSLQDNYPWIITHPPENCPQWNCPKDNCPPRQLALNRFPLDNYFPDNCSLPPSGNPRWAIATWTSDPPHSLNIFSWIIPPWISAFGQLPPCNSSRNKLQRTFVLNNCPLIIYRWCLEKALFTHSSLEVLNEFRKTLSKGLCMALHENILLCGNPFYKWM